MSATTPTSANKRPASPSSPDAVTSHKRAREEVDETKPDGKKETHGDDEETEKTENGHENGSADIKADGDKEVKPKMEDTNMDGCVDRLLPGCDANP